MKLINKKRREITLICVVVMVLVLFFSGCSIGKAVSSTYIKGNGNIAEPIIAVENDSKIQLTATNNEGQYNFIVKNYDKNGKITQIDMKYNIEISNKQDDSILIKLFKNDDEIEIKDNKSEYFTLTKEDKKQDKFRLEIKYDKTKSTSIEDIIQDIQIKVHSEQLKV